MKLLTLVALLAVAPCFAEDKADKADKAEETSVAPEAVNAEVGVTSEAEAKK